MQKHVNLVDLVKSFPTNILLQNLASIRKRTSPLKFADLAEKSENGSVSNLSAKVPGGGWWGGLWRRRECLYHHTLVRVLLVWNGRVDELHYRGHGQHLRACEGAQQCYEAEGARGPAA